MHDPQYHIAFREDVRYVQVGGVGAAVDNPVHVKVEMIELGEEGFIRDDLVDFWVAFRKPAVELDGIEY